MRLLNSKDEKKIALPLKKALERYKYVVDCVFDGQDGSSGFDTNRIGWGKPIHQLLIDNVVEIVFKGHDHFYAKQELDGIIYQTLPQPSHLGDAVNTATEYGYVNGDIIGGSGFLKVEVSNSKVIITFIKANGIIADSYSIE
ncbi:MAG: hypothetical protein WCJ58_06515 [bacterium]